MKRHPLFFALIVALGLTAADPLLAQSTSKQDEIKALKATVAKQQQQLNQQQQDLQSLRDSVTKLEGEQGQQQAQIQAQARSVRPRASRSAMARMRNSR
jgi:predicted  nucleic acid-binding Zn-ribbon protein